MIPESPWWVTLLVAVPILVLGAGRLTRTITYDDFPPSIWLRVLWDRLTADKDGDAGPWTKLFHCYICLSHWVTFAGIAWFALGFLAPWVWWSWYVFWVPLAISYLTMMVIARDTPPDVEDE